MVQARAHVHGGESKHVAAAFADVRDGKIAEQTIACLTRIFGALRDTSEACARATSETELFQRVCDMILSIGAYRIVWIGVHEVAANALVPRAAAGPVAAEVMRVQHSLEAGVFTEQDVACETFLRNATVIRSFRAEERAGSGFRTGPSLGVGSTVCLPLRRGGAPVGVVCIGAEGDELFCCPEIAQLFEAIVWNVSSTLEHRESVRALRASEAGYRSLLESLDDVVYTLDLDGRITFMSGAVSRFGFDPQGVLGKPFEGAVTSEDLPAFRAAWAEAKAGRPVLHEVRILDHNKKTRTLRNALHPVLEGERVVSFRGVATDLTLQHDIEDQLRLAQKMEAVGRLAGGVAHDFNNLLSVIGAYTDFALDAIHADDPLHSDLEEIRKAADRAEALTRQLLAFSRKQVLKPAVLDLNALVGGIERMLQRLIGEDIDLVVVLGEELGATRADPGQLEQIIMNLAVNSRDAMLNGGTLTIATANVELDADYVSHHPGAKPGPHVMISVTDTGVGMDEATQARIFEPFFTTKGIGKGTGLGLSMVYGIVEQTGGSIAVRSEVSKGTRFEIFLPRIRDDEVHAAPTVSDSARRAKANETVLVVEDEEGVRKLVQRVLVASGYQVLTAANAGEALLLCERRGAEINLLLTDVVMPGLSGSELAERLAPLCPNMKILYMSGYTDDAIAHRGVFDPGAQLIAKPFGAQGLTRRVRGVLDTA